MLRITEIHEEGHTVRLRLDGSISAESFDEIRRLCARHRESGGAIVVVDMAGVSFMTHAVAKKLARLRGDSLRIVNCTPFTAALLESAG